MKGVIRRASAAWVVALALAACVDAPQSLAAADAGDPLALTFDELARQATASGDASRAEGFTYAAIAVRSGVTPSRLDVRNGGTNESYDAFVHSVAWKLTGAAAARVPAHRTITAWRRTTDGVTRVLTLSTPSDSAPVLNPLSLSATGPLAAAFAGASGLYQETTTIAFGAAPVAASDAFWIATSGWVKVRETVVGSACQRPAGSDALSGVACQQARFVVRFDVGMQPLAKRPYEVRSAGDVRRFHWPAGDQTLTGYKLTFACATVSATRGCA